VGETPQTFPVLGGLCAFYIERAELQTAQELAEQLLHLAQRVQDPTLLLWAHLALGGVLYSLGEFTSTRQHFEQSLALYDSQRHRLYGFVYDPGVYGLAMLAPLLYLLGYPDQALKRSRQALTLAQELSHPYSVAFALSNAAEVHRMRGEQQAKELVEEAIALSREQGFASELVWGTILYGWALATQGQEEEGIAQMRQGLATYQATGAGAMLPYCLALLAEAYGKVGQTEEGLSLLAKTLALVDKTGERHYEAELYRLKGTLTLQSQVPSLKSQVEREAEKCFQKAIEIARWQQAKSLELRTVMSLARLWQQQGKKAEAQQILAEIYNWFTEGFDTADLKEAKALLQELT
jgi:predicted ATPase